MKRIKKLIKKIIIWSYPELEKIQVTKMEGDIHIEGGIQNCNIELMPIIKMEIFGQELADLVVFPRKKIK